MSITVVSVASLSGVANRADWPGFLPTRLSDLRAQAGAARALGGDIRAMRLLRSSGGDLLATGVYDTYRLQVARLDSPDGDVPVVYVDVVDEVHLLAALTPLPVIEDGPWLTARRYYFGNVEHVPEYYSAETTANKMLVRYGHPLWFRNRADLVRFEALEARGQLPFPIRGQT